MMIVSLLSYREKVENEKWKVKIYVTVEHGLSIMFGYKTVGADNIRPPLPDITNAGKINKRIMLREAGGYYPLLHPKTAQIGKNWHD
ncbi:MAG: hypothetical protein IJJ60_07560 [Clostridia bacterium]|nr:hypothetical protein [Clostridia bacterium]